VKNLLSDTMQEGVAHILRDSPEGTGTVLLNIENDNTFLTPSDHVHGIE
jgi:hypothetical protein